MGVAQEKPLVARLWRF